MNHRPQHNKNITILESVNRSRLEPGSIITFNYISEKKHRSKPLVLVLNPYYKGNLHGIKLDELSPKKVQEIVNVVKLWYSKRLNEFLKMRLPLVKVNIGSPQSFYETRLKKILETKAPKIEVYREYHANKLSSLQLVEYNFELQRKQDKEEQTNLNKERKRLAEQKQKLEKSKK